MDVEDDDFNVSFGDEEFGGGNSTFNSVVLNESLDSSFETEENRAENDGLLPASSTPKKARFKVPKPPPAKYFRKCTLCGNFLKTEKGFLGHMQGHRWKEAAKLKPPVEEVIQHCKSTAILLVDKQIEKFSVPEGQPGHLFNVEVSSAWKDVKCNIEDSEFLNFVLEKLSEVLSSKSAAKVMPSAVLFEMQCSLSSAYSCKDFRDKLLQSFLKITPAKPCLAWNMIFCFLKETFDAAFIYLCRKLRGPALEACKVRSKDDFNHHSSQQVVHHIAGACLRTHFRAAYAYPNNRAMQNIKECILDKFARVGGPSVVDKKNPQYWTSLLNRKSLFFVHEGALPFFIELSKLVQRLESADGNLSHEKVMEDIVSTRTLTTLWDSTVENSLTEDESFNFMRKVVRSLTNTFGKGMMLRRMNAMRKSGKGNKAAYGVSHRSRLIGKL